MTRERFVTATPLYHRRHYNTRGQLFDVRLGTGNDPAYDGPNADQMGTSWNRGALRIYYSSSNNDYTWPTAVPQNNNGNLYRQDIFVPATLDGANNVANYTLGVDYFNYDSLNRLVSMDELPIAYSVNPNEGWLPQSFAQRYSYDRFGNRAINTAATWGIGINRKAFAVSNNNRLDRPNGSNCPGTGTKDGMCYDVSGNLIFDNYTGAGERTYDAENRMLTATGANNTSNSYSYDADGRRVRRRVVENGVLQEYWQVYGVGGELVGEYKLVSNSPVLQKEYGQRNGQLLVIAEAANSNCQWLVADQLGTPRILSDQTGNLSAIKRRDYLPFGEDLLAGIGHRATTNGYEALVGQAPRQQFTSKERDTETGLDYFEARYYASVQGRFTSPDEFTGGPEELYWFDGRVGHNPTFYAELTEPQSLNKYTYCLNNPLRYTDPNGHQTLVADALSGAARTLSIPTPVKIALLVAEGVAYFVSKPARDAVVEFTGGGFVCDMGACATANQFPMVGATEPKEVVVDAAKHPESAKHVEDAQKAGQPDVLTVDRGGAKNNRKESLKGTTTVAGKDRDEYPPAVTQQGGQGASVRPISSSDNRGAGASIGQQIRDVPNGGRIRVVVKQPGGVQDHEQ